MMKTDPNDADADGYGPAEAFDAAEPRDPDDVQDSDFD